MSWLIAGGIGGLVIITDRTRVVAMMAEIAHEQHNGANSSDSASKSERIRCRVSSA